MLKVLNIIGTRPEAIKMAPVIRELKRRPDCVECIVCATGQHRRLLDQALELFDIRPDFDLDVMQADQTLAALNARLLTKLSQVVQEVRPDWVLAQGDTTSVLAAGMVAYYHHVAFGHVEAGLRTGDPYQPFPEEINRRVADVVASALFAPTLRSKQALLSEGLCEQRILVTGNTVVDALLAIAERPCPPLRWGQGKRLVLVTAHRRESFGKGMREICLAVRELAQLFAGDGVHFVYPVHLNPNVRKPVNDILASSENLDLLEPVDYLTMVSLMKRSTLILTDSGGIQEEAPSFHVPVLVMRDMTERPEGIEAGVARLVGTDRRQIVEQTKRLLQSDHELAKMSAANNPYGDGKAAKRIVARLLEGTHCEQATHINSAACL